MYEIDEIISYLIGLDIGNFVICLDKCLLNEERLILLLIKMLYLVVILLFIGEMML